MPVAFDTDVLSLLLDPDIPPPNDPTTGKPVTNVKARLDFLVSELQRTKSKIVIPAPVLGEFLVLTDKAGPDYLTKIDKTAVFKVEPFDAKAAAEAAAFTRQALHEGGHKKDGATGDWKCIKTDRQIAAICKSVGVTKLYSNDHDMQIIGVKAGLEVIAVYQLEVPPAEAPLLAMIQKAEDEIEGTAEVAKEAPAGKDDPRAVTIRAIASAFASATQPPSEQSHDAVLPEAPQPEPARPATPLAAQAPQPQDSSDAEP